MTYKYEFDETGGYDCMYGAFRISGPDGVVVVVDLQHYGQESCDWRDELSKAKAEVLAKRITDSLNNHSEADGEWAHDYKTLYMDLIMTVGNKYPGETRHQTAKRFIVRAEQSSDGRASQSR